MEKFEIEESDLRRIIVTMALKLEFNIKDNTLCSSSWCNRGYNCTAEFTEWCMDNLGYVPNIKIGEGPTHLLFQNKNDLLHFTLGWL